MMFEIWKLLGAFVLSFACVGLVLQYSRRTGRLDVPNHRSSHTVPKPSGGGLGFATAAVIIAGSTLPFKNTPIAAPALFAGLAALTLCAVGWLDDHGSVAIEIRLVVHLFCGIAMATIVNVTAPFSGMAAVVWLTWWIFWTVASINVVNFMDGIDGMIAGQGSVYGLFLFWLLPSRSLGAGAALIVSGACLGFALWNWAPSKIFSGDAGSGPLGLFFVFCGALAAQTEHAYIVFVPLFPLYFDAAATLVRRLRSQEKITEPHRSHLYQRVGNAAPGHAVVSAAYAFAAAVGSASMIAVRESNEPIIWAVIIVYLIAVVACWRVADRRFPARVEPSRT